MIFVNFFRAIWYNNNKSKRKKRMVDRLPDYERAEGFAEMTLVQHGLRHPPVIANKIAKAMGFKILNGIFPEGKRNIAGFVDIKEKAIYVNAEDPPARRNFTIAHELGHVILRHDFGDNYKPLYRTPIGNNEIDPQEKEANCFAANLLVPTNLLLKYIEMPDEIVGKIFGVSKDVIKYRKLFIKRAWL